MKNKGQANGMMAMSIIVAVMLFTVGVVYILLDQTIKEHIFDMGISLGANQTVIETFELGWDAFPFVFAFSLFLLLLMHAIARG